MSRSTGTDAAATWAEDNQRMLVRSLRRLRDLLSAGPAGTGAVSPAQEAGPVPSSPVDVPGALQTVVTAFGLSPFERDVLLLCAGVELDGELLRAVHSTADRAGEGGPTFGLALSLLPGAHWSALAPTAPLRRWHLVEPAPGRLLTQAPLRAAERVVHHLAGVQTLDPEIDRLVTLLPDADLPSEEVAPSHTAPSHTAPSHTALAERAARALSAARPGSTLPLVQLVGRADQGRDVAALAARLVGTTAVVLAGNDVPSAAPERERLARLWEREAVLSGCLLVLDCTAVDDDSPALPALLRFVEQVAGPVFALARRPLASVGRQDLRLVVEAPPAPERLAAWRRALSDSAPEEARLDGPGLDSGLDLERVAGQFPLSGREIHAATAELALRLDTDGQGAAALLWEICRARARPRLDHLTDRVISTATWADLVLPEQQASLLRDIASHARTRTRVYDTWGFAARSPRGLGISALFAGPSGTGKTMAAEVLANELNLDLYRIDLGRVVSKYIGETEKNLGRVFDEAEAAGGAILLFDEADALFGKRTEVRDSHDRYANLEVSYLLQRMEAYAGLAVLTTNLKSALDPAFLRRIRFVVQFPFPDAAARAQVWRAAFPAATPTDELPWDRLARLNVTGGNIRTIALNAAFTAAADGGRVGMAHILSATRTEYVKLERPLPDGEIRGWQ